ncbi:hypothetical protein Scep_026799 [Stephania cephalantha]|uniref:Uncharacterized protein n=1 Tax=Stephania cephalantha TaxID=152367 RepID=A0AAP0ENF2_9MAGN
MSVSGGGIIPNFGTGIHPVDMSVSGGGINPDFGTGIHPVDMSVSGGGIIPNFGTGIHPVDMSVSGEGINPDLARHSSDNGCNRWPRGLGLAVKEDPPITKGHGRGANNISSLIIEIKRGGRYYKVASKNRGCEKRKINSQKNKLTSLALRFGIGDARRPADHQGSWTLSEQHQQLDDRDVSRFRPGISHVVLWIIVVAFIIMFSAVGLAVWYWRCKKTRRSPRVVDRCKKTADHQVVMDVKLTTSAA